MGETLTSLPKLLAANKAIQADQRCVGWNALPLAHHALRVNNFASQHGATVHRELQHVHHLFAAVHFHVRAGGHIKRASLGSLRRFVIKQTPERSNRASSLDGGVVHVNDARVGGDDFLPFSFRCVRSPHRQRNGHQGQSLFPKLCAACMAGWLDVGDLHDIHQPYYKVVLRS